MPQPGDLKRLRPDPGTRPPRQLDMDASSSSGDDDDWEIVSTSSRPRSPSPKHKTSESGAGPAAAAAVATEEFAANVQAPPTQAPSSTSRILLSDIMPGWKDDYLSSILEAEKNSPVNQELVDACKLGPRYQETPLLPCIAQQEHLSTS